MTKKQYLGFIIITMIVGLLSRTSLAPNLIYPYAGDFLYALMFFFIVGFLFPNTKTLNTALISIGICYSIELLQLHQSDWINSLRNNKLGRLILGYGFLWSDIISYTLGGFTGFLIEKFWITKPQKIK